jgi:hypothetical protein
MSDEDLIKQAVLDYFDGWFDGDAERMERALHPGLAKRALKDDGASLEELTAVWMVEATKRGVGRERDPGDRNIDIVIADIYGQIATVTVRSAVYREYLQLVRTNEGWKIVNALWAWT